jgi:replicative DNA helicase
MVMPHDIFAEQSVLSVVFRNQELIEVIAEKLSRDDFYLAAHRVIANAVFRMYSQSKVIDKVTVSEALGTPEANFAIPYIDELIQFAASSANIHGHIQRVLDCSMRRKLITVANTIEASARTSSRDDIELVLDKSEALLSGLKHTETTDRLHDTHYILKQTIDRLEALSALQSGDGVVGLRTGIIEFDQLTSGLQGGQLIILAARPSMGKTTLAMNIVEHVALNDPKPVLVFSLEMPSEKLITRMLASLSRVDLSKIQSGQMEPGERERVISGAEILHKRAQLYLDDSSDLTPIEVRSRARRIAQKHDGLSLIMIDYLQLLRVPSKSENRTQEIADISRALKALAKELNVPVLALSQLNRTLESRQEKRPINSDLRESGAIEQDADIIAFVYRDGYYYEDTENPALSELIIGKQRNGPLATIELIFNGSISRFENKG